MERINPLDDNNIILGEHFHRYNWAKKLVKGNICDLACGMGYGSQVLKNSQKFSTYLGIDINQESIDFANKNYKDKNINFFVGSCENIPVPNRTIDTIVTLETLEHLDNPILAIAEFVRILKDDGLIIGSVPSMLFEETCTKAYGPNIYHKQKFTTEDLYNLLSAHFKHIQFFVSSLNVISLVRPINNEKGFNIDLGNQHELGSIVFLATNSEQRLNNGELNKSDVKLISPIVEYDLTYLSPRNETIEAQTKLINEKDQLIEKLEEMIRARDLAIQDTEKLVIAGTEAVEAQSNLIDEKDQLIQKLEQMISNRDEVISSQTKFIDSRDEAIKAQEALIDARDEAIEAQAKLIDGKDKLIRQLESIIKLKDE